MKQESKHFPKEKHSTIKVNEYGHKMTVNEHPFIMFDTGGRDFLYYHLKFNAYYSQPGTEPLSKEELASILPFVEWTHSKKDKDGKELYLATPENIADERKKLAGKWSEEGKDFKATDVMQAVRPTNYRPAPGYEAAIEAAGGDSKLEAFKRSLGLR